MRTFAHSMLTLTLALGLAATAQAQSAADPTGATPIGVETKSAARGPSLRGVILVEFLNSDGFTAEGARVSVRLRRGSDLNAFFARIPDSVIFDSETPNVSQGIIIDALRDQVLGYFFPDECGDFGDQCPSVDVVLKQIEEFALFDDAGTGGSSQFVIADIVVATTESL